MAEITIQQAYELAVQHHQSGRLAEAEALYRQILAVEPRHADVLNLLGVIAAQVGRHDAAIELIRQAIALAPGIPLFYSNLGEASREAGQLDAAIAAFRQAIALNPGYPEAHNNLGNALKKMGSMDEAIDGYRQAIALKPDLAEAYGNLGNALHEKGCLDEAIAAFCQAIALKPGYPEAHSNLGNALREKGQIDEAVSAYRRAIAIKPDYAEAYSNLGTALSGKGQLDEAIAAYRQAIALEPGLSIGHSNLVYTLHFHPGFDARAIAEEHRRWNDRHAEPLRQLIRPHANDRDPERRLRVGYVSPDFREHCQSLFMIPLLSQHNHHDFDIFCYANVPCPDKMTLRIQEFADTWCNTAGLSDEQLATRIREDQIDILVDLTMHMAHNQCLLFARKPAPVLVCWLAYPGSTGLTAIDYRLSDPYLDPPGMDESIYSEKTVRLPHSFWCYDPLDGRDIPLNTLPAQSNGFVTFGCLNNFCKINDSVLRLWSKVLKALPSSRLLLLAPEGGARECTLDLFAREGIDSGRIEFVSRQPRREYLELCHRIDIALDTLPYNGHTTSLDSLWMGVPVLTLVGQTIVGRAGLGQMMNLDLPEWIAESPEEYVKIAVEMAGDIPRLAELRSTLREKMQASPLMDAAGFTRDMESAYRNMWRRFSTAMPDT